MESTSFRRLRFQIGATKQVDLPWEPNVLAFSTGLKEGIEIVIKPIKDKVLVLDFLYVEPEKRRQGLATKKVKELLEHVRELGMVCYVYVSPENAVGWINENPEVDHPNYHQVSKFYYKMGFESSNGNWMVFKGN